MKLTKTQIDYIENQLIKNGVKYWDIRIELLDHVVSDVENSLKNQEDFKKTVQNSFVSLGWNGSFKELVCERLKGINKKTRKQYFKKVIKLFQKRTSFFTMIISFVLYFLVYQYLSIRTFKTVSAILLLTPSIIFVVQYFYITFKKEKSGMLLYGSFYVFFSFLILNGFIQITNPKGDFIVVSKELYKFIIFIVTVVNSVFTYAGINVYLKTLKKSRELYQKVISI